jgi:hypothetical protein
MTMKISITPDQIQQLIINYLNTKGINQNQVADITYSNKRSKGGVHVTVMYSEGIATPAPAVPVQQELELPTTVPDAEPEVIEALAQVPEAASLFD